MQSRSQTPEELRTPTACEHQRYQYEAVISDRISLPKDVSGLVAIREWSLGRGMYLRSIIQPRRYSSAVIWADETPTAGNRNGIYAWRLPIIGQGLMGFPCETVIGVVEMSGQVVVHEDGILRGECCRILMLIAHPDFAVRLSRIYGIPTMAADGHSGACQTILAWLCSHDGIGFLKWNADLMSDMQAQRLLGQVDGLNVGTEEGSSTQEMTEDLKDRGEIIQKNVHRKQECSPSYGLIVRRAALQQRYPGGWKAFADAHNCSSNTDITVLQADWPNLLDEPLTELLDRGLADQEDYVLVEPVCPKSSGSQPGMNSDSAEVSLCADWLRTQVDWLNANVNGRYRWQEAIGHGSGHEDDWGSAPARIGETRG